MRKPHKLPRPLRACRSVRFVLMTTGAPIVESDSWQNYCKRTKRFAFVNTREAEFFSELQTTVHGERSQMTRPSGIEQQSLWVAGACRGETMFTPARLHHLSSIEPRASGLTRRARRMKDDEASALSGGNQRWRCQQIQATTAIASKADCCGNKYASDPRKK